MANCPVCNDSDYYFGFVGDNCANPHCSVIGDKRKKSSTIPSGFINFTGQLNTGNIAAVVYPPPYDYIQSGKKDRMIDLCEIYLSTDLIVPSIGAYKLNIGYTVEEIVERIERALDISSEDIYVCKARPVAYKLIEPAEWIRKVEALKNTEWRKW